ncbi:MAG: OmpA family protein [Bdellovibrionaceae bacterium]|nr:OmpA family protein [Bdellovibrio sp.]
MRNLVKAAVISMMVFSCAQSVKRVSLPADTNVKTAISEGDKNIQDAYSNQWDVLAHEELMTSANYLNKAKQADRDGKDQAKVVDQLENYQAYYNEAQAKSAARTSKMTGLLSAREAVLTAGMTQNSKDRKALASLDNDFRDMADDSTIDPKDYAKLQKEYFELGALVKKNTALATARRQVEEARNNKASKNAPSALNMAELDIKSAENMVDANQGKPEMYQPAIDKANRSAALLAAIVAEQKRANYNLDENSARRLVQQSGMLAKMDADLAASKTALTNTRSEYIAAQIALQNSEAEGSEKDAALKAQSKMLTQAEADKKFQVALESARQKFSKSEADVYRQGDRLLIRLKNVGFSSGAATLPETSKTILDKVSTVAQELNPKEIVVEGHTDSVGSATVNEELSQKRADSVATYLKEKGMTQNMIKTEGYGFQKPLSTNKTKAGRAQNRRVDIWITPEGVQQAAAPAATDTKKSE